MAIRLSSSESAQRTLLTVEGDIVVCIEDDDRLFISSSFSIGLVVVDDSDADAALLLRRNGRIVDAGAAIDSNFLRFIVACDDDVLADLITAVDVVSSATIMALLSSSDDTDAKIFVRYLLFVGLSRSTLRGVMKEEPNPFIEERMVVKRSMMNRVASE